MSIRFMSPQGRMSGTPPLLQALYLKHSHFRAIDFVFGHLLTRRLDVLDEPFPDTVNI